MKRAASVGNGPFAVRQYSGTMGDGTEIFYDGKLQNISAIASVIGNPIPSKSRFVKQTRRDIF